MKRLLYIYLVTIVLLLASCDSGKPQFTIGVSQCNDDAWRLRMTEEILQEAMFYDNLDVEISSAIGKTHLQIMQIEQYIEQRVDLLIISPNDSEKLVPIVERAMDEGIPVLIIDRMVNTENFTAYVGVDNYNIGYKAGQYAVKELEGSGNIIDLGGANAMPSAKERQQGFLDVINGYENIKILSSVDTKWVQETSEHMTDSLLRIYPDVDLVFAYNDKSAYGAYSAAKNLGRDHDVKIIGITTLVDKDNSVDWIYDGSLDASVLYSVDGDLVVKTAYDILNHRPFSKMTTLESTLIDSLNVRITMLQLQQIDDLDNKIESQNIRITDHMNLNKEQHRKLLLISILCALVAVILLIIIKMLRDKSIMNSCLAQQNLEILAQKEQLEVLSKQLEDATHAKLSFFTNISHDLRTPLTLISDPVSLMLEDESLNDRQKSLLKSVFKNVMVLLRLIEQIVDFRRIENGATKLSLTNINLLDAVNEWTSAFMPTVEQKNKRIVLRSMSDLDYSITVDKAKIERVYYNVLSNAVKYSYNDTIIHVELSAVSRNGSDYLGLKIMNSCSPEVKSHIENIFERFYTMGDQSHGSGIGLSISKSYIEIHKGEIFAEYLEESSQFVMSIFLPMNRLIELQPETTMNITNIFENYSVDSGLSESDMSSDDIVDKQLILVVDDSEDIRKYICDQLSSEYQMIDAQDGLVGFDMAKRYIPDLVISDILMPGMDGLDLCKELKHALITRHIPVLLLTACIEDEQRLAGYENGADGYITKPFNIKMLKTRARNLIENRALTVNNDEKKRDRIQLRDDVTTQEEQFIERLNQFLEENYTNVKLNIDDIAEAMCYSRVQLFRKVKALCGESPNQLLKNLRLRKGDLLLRSSGCSIAEVAYEVGFSSPSYFSKNYKEFYGVSPKDIAGTTVENRI